MTLSPSLRGTLFNRRNLSVSSIVNADDRLLRRHGWARNDVKILIALLVFLTGFAHAADLNVLLSSSAVLPGETLRVELDGITPGAKVRVDFLGKRFPFYEVGPAAQRALIGIPLGTVPGSRTLKIHSVKGAANPIAEQDLQVMISTRVYEVENINLPPEKNVLATSEHNESVRIHKIALQSTRDQYWEGAFQFPVEGPIESPFGLKRTRNGTIDAGFHKGIDIKARDGATLTAANAGVIVLAASFKAHGRVVMIDHGQGVMTIYLHMQKIGVRPGQKVAKGAVIGKVGSSGLATGPHVHWQVFVHSVPVNPIPWTEQEF